MSAITVILNGAAGSVDRPQIATEIAALFHAAGSSATIIVVKPGVDVTEAARAASAQSDIVVAAGGDGTVSSVAAGVFGTTAALGVLPLGTLNHFARDLGLPLDLAKAVAVIAARHIGRIDVGQVNGRVFVNNSSIGIYPSIIDAREELRRQGHRKWPAMALAVVRILRRYRGIRVKIDADGRPAAARTPFVFVGNNEYAIGGVHVGSRARLDQGRLFAYLAPRVRTRELPLLLARALAGRTGLSGDFTIMSASELWIELPRAKRVRVALDGEVQKMTTPLHYQACPGALRVVFAAPSGP